MAVTVTTDDSTLTPESVPLGTGPPTREELLVYYPAKFTWTQLKTFINSGDLGLLKRDRKLQARYDAWAAGIRKKYGSTVNYLLSHRLQWGKPDQLSALHSILDEQDDNQNECMHSAQAQGPTSETLVVGELPPIPADAPPYFTADTPPELISITMNDWPYSVPPEIEHTLVWARLPIIPPDLPPSIAPRVLQDGMWGFTGSIEPAPSADTLPDCLPSLAEWDVTLDKLVRSPPPTEEEAVLLEKLSQEIDAFVQKRWKEAEWETAWFVNPPRLQSIPGLAHAHVFARHKSPKETAEYLEKKQDSV
ncbi:uncharacterized protein LAESUDRAFT_722943 [Laetiporus sulphureus 93-53]|uniref:Uncharacterized protein n=1 Tax=Laetiporus sulphureus 93-53 TaxID=1314785 RepID=A0A165FN05_9APHY|nr:uncharacterized protein LAESUDRAFT_722943 [Laetiporus sulphureus 93-53]KZT09214.1 hypothetical protein LAESUDRAFT_722943 [Laetiporus sulphureus 93-53]